jgi:hypothetical protein
MAPMPVVLVLAAVVILAGVVVVAMGRGGELALPRPDSAVFGKVLRTPADLVAFRPPAAFLGYSAQVTDEALRRVARLVAERDAELAMLRHELAVLRARESQPGRPAGYADPGTYTALDTDPDLPGYGAAPSFSAARAADPLLEPYESAPGRGPAAGDPGDGRDAPVASPDAARHDADDPYADDPDADGPDGAGHGAGPGTGAGR